MHSNTAACVDTVTKPPAINLLLADDHGIVREGLRALLEDGEEFVIVGEAGSGEEACDAVRRLRPDIVLMDLKMPGMAACDAIHVIRASVPSVRVIVLTGCTEDAHIQEVMTAGAAGYIFKDVGRADLVTALRAIASGETWLHPLAQRLLVEQLRHRRVDPLAVLTQRERGVLDLIAHGMNNRQIGEALHLTEGSVKGHVSAVLAKLKLEDRTQAALFAVEHGARRKQGGA